MRAAAGTNSRRSASRFDTISWTKKLIPVTLPLGRLSVATRPSLTGSSPAPKTTGIVAVAALAARAAGVKPGVAMTATRRWTKSATSPGTRSVLAFKPVIFDRDVASLDAARFTQALPECRSVPDRRVGRPAVEQGDHRHSRLLRPRCERPCHRTAEQADEFPPPHAGHGLPPRCRRRSYQLGSAGRRTV